MTLAVEDIADLLKLLKEHPEWRDQLRPVILGDEILQLPSRMDRVEAAIERLTLRLDALTERLDQLAKEVGDLTTAVRDLAIRVDRTEGRLANIDGQMLEGRYDRQLGSWFSTWLLKPERISTSTLSVVEAATEGRISEAERTALENLDMLVHGRDRSGSDQGALTLAVELSHTINLEDVERADSRASILHKLGHRSRAFVGGYRITEEAQRLAEKLDVIVDLHRPAA